MVSLWFCLGKAEILLCSMKGVLTTRCSGFPTWLLEGCLLVPSKFKNVSLWASLRWKNLLVVMEMSKKKISVPFCSILILPNHRVFTLLICGLSIAFIQSTVMGQALPCYNQLLLLRVSYYAFLLFILCV